MQVSRVELDGVRQSKSRVGHAISRIQHLKEVRTAYKLSAG